MKSTKTIRKISFGAILLLLSVAVFLSVILGGGRTVHYASAHNGSIEQAPFSEELFNETMDRFQAQSVSESISFSGWLYDEQFAGVWYDEQGRLNIGIANSGMNMSTNNVQSNGNPNIVYHERQFSWNFLVNIHSHISDLMPAFSIHGTALLPQYNQAEIRLEKESYIFVIREHLKEIFLYEYGAISFIVEEMARPMSGTPIHGGGRIVGRGTISSKAICNTTNRAGIVTNAHVWNSTNTNLREGVSNNIIGTTRAQALMQGVADATFVPFTDQNAWLMNSSASWLNSPTGNFNTNNPNNFSIASTTYQVATRAQIQVGRQVVKFGQTTGRTAGTITAVGANTSVGPFYDGTTRQFTDQIRTSANTYRGDSGSPLFIINDGRYVLAATIFAAQISAANPGVPGPGIASKITNVIAALNVTIMTQAIFNTHNISNTEVEIRGTTRNLAGNVVLPNNFNDGIRTRTVTRIGASAFSGHNQLSQTTIPPTVISVGIDAFNANTNVIWNYAFSVSNLSATTAEVIRPLRAFTSLSIPTILNGRTIVRIRTGAFIDQLQLTQASVPATVGTTKSAS